MAQMIPSEIPRFGGGLHAEGVLFNALRAGLPNEFYVYSRLTFLDQDAREGEADFLVLHPEHGMLLIECKGSGVERRRDGTWTRQVDGRETRMSKSPFDQAREGMHRLRDELHSRINRLFPGVFPNFPFTYGYAVAFPLAVLALEKATFPLEMQPPILWDATDVQGILEIVKRTFAFWRAKRAEQPRLAEERFHSIRRSVLQPTLRLTQCLSARLEAEGEVIRRLTDQQVRILVGLKGSRQARIIGGAGTGKTLLAREMMRELAFRGARVLFTCFNRNLAAFLRESLRTSEFPGDGPTVRHFHGLCNEAAAALGETPRIPAREDIEGSRRYWDDDAPFALMRALDAGHFPRFDAIVVDEAQDFLRGWWDILEGLLMDNRQGKIFAFLDPHQTIFGRDCAVPSFETVFQLRDNLRNTKNIAAALQQLTGDEVCCPQEMPSGEPVSVHQQKAGRRTLHGLESVVERLVKEERIAPDRIVLLSPHTRPNSSLAGVEAVAGFALSDDPLRRGGQLLHSTFGAFKGLETDVAILFDVDPGDPRCDRNARYVAASRARHVLHVFAKDNWLA